MDFTTNFIAIFFKIFANSQMPFWKSFILTVLSLTLIFIIARVKILVKLISSKFNKKKRSCGDCFLLMYGISTKYRTLIQSNENKVLKTQMLFVEQRIETLIFELLRTYKEDQINYSKETKLIETKENLERDYINYKEALSNSIELCKHETRRSFKDNGFHEKSGKEFSDYVKDKTQDLLAISRKYLMNSYYKNAFVPLEYRFDNFDESKFEDIVFEIFIKAKDIINISITRTKELEEQFKLEIDNFVKEIT